MIIGRRGLLQALGIGGFTAPEAKPDGPTLSIDVLRGVCAVHGTDLSDTRLEIIRPALTRPKVGFRPTMPQLLAGWRIDPPLSVPMASGTMPAASAAPEPLDDPDGERDRSHGLWAGPTSPLCWLPIANSTRVSLPMRIAPAWFRRAVTVDS